MLYKILVDNGMAKTGSEPMASSISTKRKIIDLLRGRQGWISGEDISSELGISRAAVAKHISALRTQGYLIDAVSRRGYFLKMEPDQVDVEIIKNSLKTKIIGQGSWVWRDKTESTNTEAALLAAGEALEGSLVLADLQTSGRGRRKRQWFSAPRSVQFSVLLNPDLSSRQLSILSLLACLSVQHALTDLTKMPYQIKWPNDILLNGKKIAAVLVEANIAGGELCWAVIGVGCNLNVMGEEFPEELRTSASSVFEESRVEFARNLVYAKIIESLDEYYNILIEDGALAIIEKWKGHTDIIGLDLTIAGSGQNITGKAIGISPDGLLIVVDKTGKEHQFEAGDYYSGGNF